MTGKPLTPTIPEPQEGDGLYLMMADGIAHGWERVDGEWRDADGNVFPAPVGRPLDPAASP